MPRTRARVLLARQIGVPAPVVFLNRADRGAVRVGDEVEISGIRPTSRAAASSDTTLKSLA